MPLEGAALNVGVSVVGDVLGDVGHNVLEEPDNDLAGDLADQRYCYGGLRVGDLPGKRARREGAGEYGSERLG